MENTKSASENDTLAMGIERFSSLCSEMVSVLEELRREMSDSAARLRETHAELEKSRRELENLCEIKEEASALEQRVEDLRRQKDALEHWIATQQSVWEQEREKREREEREHLERLRARREREIETSCVQLDGEPLPERTGIVADPGGVMPEYAESGAAREAELAAREAAVQKKEREIALLMSELESFLSEMATRMGAEGGLPDLAQKKTVPAADQNWDAGSETQGGLKGGFAADNLWMWEGTGTDS